MSGPALLYVVDDERVVANTWTIILRNAGYRTIGFTNPIEALTSLSTERPQLLISDVRMPEMSGVTLALRAKEIDPSIRVLLISGMASTEDLTEEARNRGYYFPILSKPIYPTELLDAIQTLLAIQKRTDSS